MIYPTRSAILAVAAGAPVALAVAVLAPDRWYAGLAWPVAVLLLGIIDAFTGARMAGARVALDLPPSAGVGAPFDATLRLSLASPAPRRVQVALARDPLLTAEDDGRVTVRLDKGRGAGLVTMTPRRRGTARFDRLWLRWRGSLGLVWKQRVWPLASTLPVLPDIRPVRERGAQIFQRTALQGFLAQIRRGDGTEFESLVEYQPGMDRRAIDWKQSARHTQLHAREFRPERNTTLVLAIDAGRQMCEPVDEVPRIDRAVSAALLTAWVALKIGDRVSMFAFDSRPRLSSGAVSGTRAFGMVQRLAAQIDYSGDETNYTLALTTLAGQLNQRAMIVLFTEFTDLTSAEFMVRAAGRLAETHLLLVVVLVDQELETLVAAEPVDPDDIARTVTAAALLRERAIVLTRLRHLGIHVIESPHGQVAERLVAGYLDLKRRNLL